jgi:hypothetical protein
MCVGTIVLHFAQMVSVLGRFASCDRRFPVRELECFRFGTAIRVILGRWPAVEDGRDNLSICQEASNDKLTMLRDALRPVNAGQRWVVAVWRIQLQSRS